MSGIDAIVHDLLVARLQPLVWNIAREEYAYLMHGDPGAGISLGILSTDRRAPRPRVSPERPRFIAEHLPPAPEPLTKRQRRRARGHAMQSRHPTRS